MFVSMQQCTESQGMLPIRPANKIMSVLSEENGRINEVIKDWRNSTFQSCQEVNMINALQWLGFLLPAKKRIPLMVTLKFLPIVLLSLNRFLTEESCTDLVIRSFSIVLILDTETEHNKMELHPEQVFILCFQKSEESLIQDTKQHESKGYYSPSNSGLVESEITAYMIQCSVVTKMHVITRTPV